ncbi:MAG: phosphoribosylformylglycinamidine cyclo-ligase [Rickettsiaceae bacterium]|jgi:phosphoribosylformylglycinamidine cyclo-ligase|nr:phosphoribosylformylglycinamidine cyclo-ligase [Rickettsiaceae bacterium]
MKTSENNRKLSYKDSGVDIDAGNELVNRIKPFAKSTIRTGADADLGGFGALFDLAKCGYKDPILVSSTDGVGTKLKIAKDLNLHDTIGIDLVAMCVNDLVVQGAEPLFFLDYFASGKLSLDVASDVIKGIAAGCKMANCALIGGETAEMPGLYGAGDYDLAGFTVGVVERENILPKNIAAGDIILGLKSSGVHSNGFSLVRHILKEKNISLDHQLSNKKTLGSALLEPTKIYVRSCLNAIKTGKVKGLAHITGGGLLENIPRVLPKNLFADIDYSSWQLPELFQFLQNEGNVEDEEMHRTFNCGIGMVLIVDKNDIALVKNKLAEFGEEAIQIGIISKQA